MTHAYVMIEGTALYIWTGVREREWERDKREDMECTKRISGLKLVPRHK